MFQRPNPRLQFTVLLEERRLQLGDPLSTKRMDICFRSFSLHFAYSTPLNPKSARVTPILVVNAYEKFKRVRATRLYVATKLSDLLDKVVIVGGLVPSLLVPQTRLPTGAERHVGTMHLDMGLVQRFQSQA